jgi:hypothetical protein
MADFSWSISIPDSMVFHDFINIPKLNILSAQMTQTIVTFIVICCTTHVSRNPLLFNVQSTHSFPIGTGRVSEEKSGS